MAADLHDAAESLREADVTSPLADLLEHIANAKDIWPGSRVYRAAERVAADVLGGSR